MGIDITNARTPGLLRRLAAILYDGMVLLGILILAVALVVIPYEQLSGTPFPQDAPLHRLALRAYLLLVIGAFFSYFWVRGGQTLGMRAWRLRVLHDDGEPLGWGDAWRRFAFACLSLAPFGLGLLWCLLDRDGLAWHDRLSRTRPVLVIRK